MRFGEAIKKIEGLRLIADNTPVLSEPGRVCLMQSPFITDTAALEKEIDFLRKTIEFLSRKESREKVEEIRRELMKARDISNTIYRIKRGNVPDDVELFEIKGLAILCTVLRNLTADTLLSEIDAIDFPSLEKVVEILDPEHTGNTHFHIYDAYSPSLAEKRRELKALQANSGCDEERGEKLTAECMLLEDEVKAQLGTRLQPYAEALSEALQIAGKLDCLMAKAALAVEQGQCLPDLTEQTTEYTALEYPPVKIRLEQRGESFQPVDITLHPGVTLITGANMGGKTITLKSVALAQALAQFGFGVPASHAGVCPVEDIECIFGDSQSSAEGLSSFGAEILQIDGVLRRCAQGEKLLVLIDEPARTTNPEEGRAIASAVIDSLAATRSLCLLTTHYSNIPSECRRLKVKGVKDGICRSDVTGPDALRRLMDYSLLPDSNTGVDREALRIARLIGISRDFSEKIENRL